MADSKKRSSGPTDPVVRELDAIKRLLMLQLVKDGVEAKDIATVLGVVQSTVSEAIPVRRLKSLKKRAEE
jgi:predicted transcriptional regulator